MPVIEKPNSYEPLAYDRPATRVTCPTCKGEAVKHWPESSGNAALDLCYTCKGVGTISDMLADQLRRMSAS